MRIAGGFLLYNQAVPPPVLIASPTPSFIIPITGDGTVAEQLAQIDDALRQALPTSIAYNAPQAMELDETVTLELLLNPSIEPGDLGEQVTEPGQVVSTVIQVTPRMKAELIASDADAFDIQPLHDNPEQFNSGTETTRWDWDVTARQGGTHRLTLIIYRLITVDGVKSWRHIKTYRSDIDVQVTLTQRIMMLDWKWIVGILVTALLIPAFWRYVDNRRKKKPTKRSK